jgi:hypothetical protein
MLKYIHQVMTSQEAALSQPEHEFTLNPAGVKVTHAAFDGSRPLCGWSADGETVTADPAEVTCADCQAAQG